MTASARAPAHLGGLGSSIPDSRFESKRLASAGRAAGPPVPCSATVTPVFVGARLGFKAHVTQPMQTAGWWQVANAGGHARA